MKVLPGVYQLRIRLRGSAVIVVGALGERRFGGGWYVYSGSARNGLVQRIERHLREEKRRHWHIDYLLGVADGVEAFVCGDATVTECDLHRGMVGGGTAVAGFGSSDCRCGSHLVYFKRRPTVDLVGWDEFLRGLRSR